MFGEEFKSLRDHSRREKATIFFAPHDAAFAIKLLIDRMKIMNNFYSI